MDCTLDDLSQVPRDIVDRLYGSVNANDWGKAVQSLKVVAVPWAECGVLMEVDSCVCNCMAAAWSDRVDVR